ncbi:uncharacterized protein LOC129590208 [Paramacrobiotus metropolitanus]|uniref:uncharacterized protein LOC129590208 n=1 Tax=Paramacrobiotus metropolitanus TaxID=2943436 RepID=UPI0024457983|nr:uncharacterized protein LOC129590208 [Paramacrobiotus metropolitanus]XP_055341285.1 uncharacterized protein LOC129590208 [Paramacrobiotus metropolitanus]XP_055341286.1 uncharacterized protein LOC129590208 [Paramacrobiotus metropolitanus]
MCTLRSTVFRMKILRPVTLWCICSAIFQISYSVVQFTDNDQSLSDHRISRRSLNMYVYANGNGPIYPSNSNRTLNTGYGSSVTATSSNTGSSASGAPYVPPSPYSSGIAASSAGTPYRPPVSPYSGSPYGSGSFNSPSSFGYNNPQRIGNYADDDSDSYAGSAVSQGLRSGGYSRPSAPYNTAGSASFSGNTGYTGSRYPSPVNSGFGYSGSFGSTSYNSASLSNRYTTSTGYGSSTECSCPRDTYAYDIVYEGNACNTDPTQPYYCTNAQCDALEDAGYAVYAPEQVSVPICALGQAGYEVLDFAVCFKPTNDVKDWPLNPLTGYTCGYEIQCSPPLQNSASPTPDECLKVDSLNYIVETTGKTGCDAYKACNTNYRCNVGYVCRKAAAGGSPAELEVLAESKDIQLTLSTDCTGCHYCPESKDSCLAKKYNFLNSTYGASGYNSQNTNYNGGLYGNSGAGYSSQSINYNAGLSGSSGYNTQNTNYNGRLYGSSGTPYQNNNYFG